MRIGIDLGGTKVEGLLLADDGTEVARHRIATPQNNYWGTVDAIVGLVERLGQQSDMRIGRFGVGIPGSLSPITNHVRNANSTWLNGSDLPGDLEKASGLKVRVANDANCFALSEASDGAADGAPVVFGVILGTGVGGGLVVGGDIVEGRNRIGGEWGHNPLPSPNDDERPGPACFCGRHGCIETFLSGPGMTRDHARRTGEAVDADMIVRSAQEGHGDALSTLDRYERRLAKSLAGIINIVDPDVIVLGGGLSNLTRLYRNVPQLWPDQVFSDSVDTRLVPARHGDSSGVRGAAWLWPEGRDSL